MICDVRKNVQLALLVSDLKHLTAGFPSYPLGQVHIGLCILA